MLDKRFDKRTWKIHGERPFAKEKPILELCLSLYTMVGTKDDCVSAAWQKFSEIGPWEYKQFDVS